MLGAGTLDLRQPKFFLVQWRNHFNVVVVLEDAFGGRIVPVGPRRFSLQSLKLLFLAEFWGIGESVFVSGLAVGLF